MPNSISYLITRLKKHIQVDSGLEDSLRALAKKDKSYMEGEVVFSSGDEAENLFIVEHGWFLTYTDLPDGGRMVVNVHLPGDVIGFGGVAFDYRSIYLKSCSDGCLRPFSKKDLDAIFVESPELAALLFTLAVREKIVFIDRLKTVTRMSSEPRLAHFLLDILFRLRVAKLTANNEFRLPITQTEIGDAIGLTNVSVSRTFTSMEKQGLVKRTAAGIMLINEPALMDLCSFEDRYTKVDTSWFPPSR